MNIESYKIYQHSDNFSQNTHFLNDRTVSVRATATKPICQEITFTLVASGYQGLDAL